MQCGQCGVLRNGLQRAKLSIAEIGLIEPHARLLRYDGGNALSLHIHPALRPSIQPRSDMLQAGCVKFLHIRADNRMTISKFKRWQRFFEIAAILLAFVTILRDRSNKRSKRMTFLEVIRIIAYVLIGKIGGAHQAILSDAGLIRKVMEHQRTLTQAIRAHLEARAIPRKGIVATEPGLRLSRRRS